mgnify:CR=1 FL=1
MVSNDVAAFLSPAAKRCGFRRGGYLCFEEDTQEEVVLRELLDKKLWKIPERIKDKAAFEENINRSIKRYNPEYWRARQSGLEAVQSAQSIAVSHNNQQVDQEHLCAALLGQEDSLIKSLIERMGSDAEGFAGAVGATIARLPQVTGSSREADRIYVTQRPVHLSARGCFWFFSTKF